MDRIVEKTGKVISLGEKPARAPCAERLTNETTTQIFLHPAYRNPYRAMVETSMFIAS